MIYQEHGAIFSNCRTHRYMLWRGWHETANYLLFVCLNPSVAGACQNDRTLNHCIGFAQRADYSGLYLVNLCSFISTPSAGLLAAATPFDIHTDHYINVASARCCAAIAAWGDDGTHLRRDKAVTSILRGYFPVINCLAKTASGNPGHPLYIKGTNTLRPFP